MEYLQVFNENKEMLNEKIARDEKNNIASGKYFMIILLFIENSEGKFLLQKTSKSRNSCMATTGGHVTFGDDALKTVIKEAKEELDLDLTPKELKYIDTIKYKNCYLETYYVKKDININDLKVQEEEVEYVNWYSDKEINEFISKKEFREGNIEPFKRVLNKKRENNNG